MSHRLKITIKNETDYALLVQEDAEASALKPPAVLATGSSALPAGIKPRESCDFTVSTPINGPGPEGSLVLQLDSLQLQAVVSWTDFLASAGDKDAFTMLNPCSCADERLDGATGELDATIEYFNEKGESVDFASLPQYETSNTQRQKSAIDEVYKHPQVAPAVPMPVLEARFTLKVKVPPTIGNAPSRQPATAPDVAARPKGSSKVVIGAQVSRWDAPGISQRRKKLLAAIGNCFPMVWDRQPPDVEGRSNIPYQDMGCWSPGKGTSCTNVATYIEGLLTGRNGKWGFPAHLFEEAWVPWGANPSKPMPNVGDVYLMYSDLERLNNRIMEKPQMRHVGFILHVPKDETELWVTADGGQNGKAGKGFFGGGAFLAPKRWVKRLPTATPKLNMDVWKEQMKAHVFASPIKDTPYPYLTGGAESNSLDDANRLIGWLDIDSPAISFLSEEFDEPFPDETLDKPGICCQQVNRWNRKRRFTEDDYWFVGAWINTMLGASELDGWIAHIKDPANRVAPTHSQPSAATLSERSRYLPV